MFLFTSPALDLIINHRQIYTKKLHLLSLISILISQFKTFAFNVKLKMFSGAIETPLFFSKLSNVSQRSL